MPAALRRRLLLAFCPFFPCRLRNFKAQASSKPQASASPGAEEENGTEMSGEFQKGGIWFLSSAPSPAARINQAFYFNKGDFLYRPLTAVSLVNSVAPWGRFLLLTDLGGGLKLEYPDGKRSPKYPALFSFRRRFRGAVCHPLLFSLYFRFS